MGEEIKLDNTIMIVSETDEKGNIIYANTDFCKICGYTKEELIGKPHNIVRHRDMPSVAFKGLWDDIKSGNEWRGIVKNKAKNGAFYWVRAYVYSVSDKKGKRFISVRTKPTQHEIKEAEALYLTLQ